MSKGRLEAFSDGVLAIIITIMVLEMSAPQGHAWSDLREVLPIFLGYIVSYSYVGIYWINHHRLITSAEKVSGRMLWTNLLWMFFVSLIPFATEWASEAEFSGAPGMLYSLILLLSAIAYHILAESVCRANGEKTNAVKLIVSDKRSLTTVLCYIAAMPLAYYLPIATYILYIIVEILWILPDIRNDSDK